MPLLIDTYNVLHTTGILPPELATTEIDPLVKLLQASRYRDDRITLACDGVPGPKEDPRPVRRIDNITIRYSGHGKPADDLIAQMIAASTAPRQLIVVSSDHAVLRSARKRRCRLLTSEEFLQQISDDHAQRRGTTPPDKPKPGSMSQQQIDRWVQLFGVDDQMLALAPGQLHSQTQSRHGGSDFPSSDPASQQSHSDSKAGNAAAAAAEASAEHNIPELEPGNELPRELIDQAERLWAEHNLKDPKKDAP